MAAMWEAEQILDSKPMEHAIVLMMAAPTAERLDVGSSVAAGAAGEWRTAVAAILDLRPRFARIGLAAVVVRFVAAAELLTARSGSGCHHTAAVEAAAIAVGATTAAGSVVIR